MSRTYNNHNRQYNDRYDSRYPRGRDRRYSHGPNHYPPSRSFEGRRSLDEYPPVEQPGHAMRSSDPYPSYPPSRGSPMNRPRRRDGGRPYDSYRGRDRSPKEAPGPYSRPPPPEPREPVRYVPKQQLNPHDTLGSIASSAIPPARSLHQHSMPNVPRSGEGRDDLSASPYPPSAHYHPLNSSGPPAYNNFPPPPERREPPPPPPPAAEEKGYDDSHIKPFFHALFSSLEARKEFYALRSEGLKLSNTSELLKQSIDQLDRKSAHAQSKRKMLEEQLQELTKFTRL